MQSLKPNNNHSPRSLKDHRSLLGHMKSNIRRNEFCRIVIGNQQPSRLQWIKYLQIHWQVIPSNTPEQEEMSDNLTNERPCAWDRIFISVQRKRDVKIKPDMGIGLRELDKSEGAAVFGYPRAVRGVIAISQMTANAGPARGFEAGFMRESDVANPIYTNWGGITRKCALRLIEAVRTGVVEGLRGLLARERVEPIRAVEVEGIELQTEASSSMPDLTARELKLVGVTPPSFLLGILLAVW
jgi:hypothetical protein